MGGVNDDSRIRRNPLAAPVVAMIGGGQLARMTHQAAVALGQTLRVLAADGSETTVKASDTAPYSAFVWKTIADPFAGRITMLRVVSSTGSARAASW